MTVKDDNVRRLLARYQLRKVQLRERIKYEGKGKNKRYLHLLMFDDAYRDLKEIERQLKILSAPELP